MNKMIKVGIEQLGAKYGRENAVFFSAVLMCQWIHLAVVLSSCWLHKAAK